MTEEKTCNICCEIFNNSTKQKITCEYNDCNFECCKTCVRSYIVSTSSDPNCMNCKKIFSPQFLILNLNRSWVQNDYNKHRKQLLLDRCMAQLIEAQPEVKRYKEIENQKIKIQKAKENLDLAKKILFNEQINLNKIQSRGKDRSKFIMACPLENCKGFLNQKYKCGLCEVQICSNCLEVKTEDHECNADNVATAELIKANSKPCPGCGERISKVSGCDQMWCISCKTAFSWKSGKIDNGIVHNPHFFQHQQELDNQTNNQNGLDECNTNVLPTWGPIRRIAELPVIRQTEFKLKHEENLTIDYFRSYKNATSENPPFIKNIDDNCRLIYPNLANVLKEVYRLIIHVSQFEIPNLNDRLQNLENTMPVRLNYLIHDKSKDYVAKELMRRDKERYKFTQILHLYQLINHVGREAMWGIVNYPEENKDNFVTIVNTELNKFMEILKYCNNHLISLSTNMRIKVPIFYSLFKSDHRVPSTRRGSIWRLDVENYTIYKTLNEIQSKGWGYEINDNSILINKESIEKFVDQRILQSYSFESGLPSQFNNPNSIVNKKLASWIY